MDRDREWMKVALRLAARGRGRTSPNPMVGAVVVSGDEMVADGWHRGPGLPHAERVALERAGVRARGATLYVTLEPCTHHGRTPPCTEAVIDAGVGRVVAAVQDPDPIVSGRGIAALRASGIPVEVGVMAEAASAFYRPYFTHRTKHRPFVTYKAAASFDGRTAAADGSSRWISGEASRRDVQRMRASSDALCVGVGTVLADDPRLTVRTARAAAPPVRVPVRVVVDSLARTPPGAGVVSEDAATIIVTTSDAPAQRVGALRDAGAEVVVMDADGGRVSLKHLVEFLAGRGIVSLLLEGGATLAGAFAAAGLIDLYVLYVAPKLLGADGAPGLLSGWSAASITDARMLRIEGVRRVGEDLRVEASPVAPAVSAPRGGEA